ncbi:MAG TPA: hypothetical protein VNT79_04040 [Phycisphaerae bacterium]|nr:hypothetical protein [Phycisphaerae bacterium]
MIDAAKYSTLSPGAMPRRCMHGAIGSLILIAAVLGTDVATITLTGLNLRDRSANAQTRSFSAPMPGGLDSATGLGWTAAALVFVVLARRIYWTKSSVDSHAARYAPITSIRKHANRPRKVSLSFHTGGLYGP